MSDEIKSLIGQTVGDYKIVKLLGEGGMGEVYAAEHRTLGHRTAFKVLRREIMNNQEAVERFRQEARLIARVRHQNLIDIFDIGELPDGRLYYVMEHLSGQALSGLLEKKRLPFREVMQIARQLCAGLAAAHQAGIVHRDLKPDNLFLVERAGEPPLVKLVDFGIAKTIGVEGESMKLTRTGTLVGTPFYMAPEQINGGKVDVRTDLYAVGVILYEMCTGKLPFGGETLGEVLIGHLQKTVPPLEAETKQWGIPQAVAPILAKLLAKSPDERYSTVTELLQDLERLQRGEQTTAGLNKHLTLSSLPQVEVPRRRRFIALAMLPFVLCAIAIGSYLLIDKLRGRGRVDEIDMVALRSLALKILQEGLGDGDPAVRGQAVGALEDSRDSRHRSLLEGRLRDADPQVQMQAARALGVIGNRAATAALLHRADEGGDPVVIVALGESLAKLGAPAGRSLLSKSLDEERYPQVQLQAALALLDLGDDKAKKLIDARLGQSKPTDDNRVEILSRRAQIGDGEAKTQLVQILPEGIPSHPRQIRVASLLASLGDERARGLLSDVAIQPGVLQVSAAHALCLIEDQSGQPALRTTLWTTGAGMPQRILAAQGIGHCGDKQDATKLSQTLRGGERSGILRQAEAGALLKLCDGDPLVLAERSVSWAEQALGDEDWNVRAQAVAALGDVSAPQAMPLLRKAMRDNREEVRRAAADSLARIGGKDAIAALAEGLSDQSAPVRTQMMRAIAKTSQLASSDTTMKGSLMDALKKGSGQGGSGEQVARAAALVALGDQTQSKEVERMVATGDAEAQAMAVEMSDDVPQTKLDWLTKIVGDEKAAAGTRLRAAVSLARAGSRAGLALLNEAIARGGAEAVWAQSALLRLGEKPTQEVKAESVTAALQSSDVEVRRSTVEALGGWPAKQAVPLLHKAARDPSVLVRGQALDSAAQLEATVGGPHPGLAVVRVLTRDSDPALRERTLTVLSKLQRAGSASGKPAAEPARVIETKRSNTVPAGDPNPTMSPDGGAVGNEPPPTPIGNEKGFLHFEGPAGTQVQIDKQPPHVIGSKPVEVSVGEHRITYPGGQQEVTVTAGATVTIKIAASQLTDMVRAGVEAYLRKDYRKARKLLEKASTQCTRKKEDKAVCAAVGYELSFHLGQTYEAQEAWAQAMTEYDKIQQPGFFGKVKSDGHKAVSDAMKRVAPRVGRLRVSKVVAGRCQTEDIWMPPGRHRVNVGGGQMVQVRPQETIEVKGCP